MFRKNTAGQFIHVQGVDSTNGAIKSGVTWTVRRCIDGTFAAATGTTTEDGTTGWYKFAMSQADTNGDDIGFNFTGTGAVPQTVNLVTTACNPTLTSFGLSIAKTTNITGFNDIAATAVVSAGAITTSGGAVSTVTNTTQLNGAATVVLTDASSDAVIADAVWNAATATYGGAGSYGLLVETDLDAAISSRMATYTQPTGFLTATFPAGTVANTTNITAGTITTVTNLTNAPTVGDLTAAMKASVNTEADTAIVDARLDELLAADSDIDGVAPPVVGSVFHELLTKTAGSFTYDQATDSLEALRDRGDAAWITATGFATPTNITAATGIVLSGVTHTGAVIPTVTTLTGHTPQTGDSFARIGVAGAGLTALGDTRIANLDAAVTTRATPAQVNAEVLDVLNVDTFAESAAVPAATASIVDKIRWLCTLARNKITQTATTQTLRNDADGANIATSTVSDDGTTFTRNEFV